MFSFETAAKLKDRLPWRVRRRLESLQLRSLRFMPGQSTLHIRDGSVAATLIAVGDIALSGTMADTTQSSGAENLRGGIFSECDLRIGNLETVITDADKPVRHVGSLLKAPSRAAGVLTATGFDVLTLANNHARDCGVAALRQCCGLLKQQGIQYCGVGSSPEESRLPAIVEVGGLKVGLLGFCDNFRIEVDAAENVTPAPAHDRLMVNDIRALRPQVDLLILQLHWGWEFSFYPLRSYRDRARQLAEAGADLVLCHHAHVPMGVEVWKSSVIAHGLGNFIFPRDRYLDHGHPWSYRTYALKVSFNVSGVLHAEVEPFSIGADGFPRKATGTEASEILGGVGRASARLEDNALLDWVERDRTVREVLHFFSLFQKSSEDTAQEWALQLLSPFRQDNIGRLGRQYGRTGERLAEFLMQLSESSANPGQWLALQRLSRERGLVSSLTCLQQENPIAEDLPGRIP